MDKHSLADLFSREQLAAYTSAQSVDPLPAEALPPIAVEHRAPQSAVEVRFMIKGVAWFTPQNYDSASIERNKTNIVNAITRAPEEGPAWWLPEVSYELTDVWDEQGSYATQRREAVAQASPESVPGEPHANLEPLIDAILSLQGRVEEMGSAYGSQLAELRRDIANERTARLLESAPRRDAGPSAGLPGVHAGGDGDVPVSAGGGAARGREHRPAKRTGRSQSGGGPDAGQPRVDGRVADRPGPRAEGADADGATGAGAPAAGGAEAADPQATEEA